MMFSNIPGQAVSGEVVYIVSEKLGDERSRGCQFPSFVSGHQFLEKLMNSGCSLEPHLNR